MRRIESLEDLKFLYRYVPGGPFPIPKKEIDRIIEEEVAPEIAEEVREFLVEYSKAGESYRRAQREALERGEPIELE